MTKTLSFHEAHRLSRKLVGRLAAAVAIGAQFFAATAAAKRFPIPSDQPVATADISDSWQPTVAPNGVEAVGLEGAVCLPIRRNTPL